MVSPYDNRSDEALVTHAKYGNQDAFGVLFLRYKGEIYAYLIKVVHDDEIARDLWQDTYVKAWRYVQDLKEPSRFKGWLLTIARRLALDWLREKSYEKTDPLEESPEGTYDPVDRRTDPEVTIERDYVRFILAEMDPIHRDVLLLNADGYSRTEIAQRLGYKESTVTTYLSSARKQFRQLYQAMSNTDS